MLPEVFRIPILGWPIYGYGLMIVIGFVLCTALAEREAVRRGLPVFVQTLGLVMLGCGVVGGRTWYFVENFSTQFAGPGLHPFFEFFKIWKGGLISYGGFLGGFAGGLLYLRWRRLPVGDCLDAVAAYVPIGMGFGRIGCFLNGCCYGKVCGADFPLGIIFPRDHPQGGRTGAFEDQLSRGLLLDTDRHSLAVHPAQLYEAGFDFVLFFLLRWYLRGPSPRRGGFPLLFITYGLGRFFLEYFRGDNPPAAWSLSLYQVFSLAQISFFAALFILFWKKDLGFHLSGGERAALEKK